MFKGNLQITLSVRNVVHSVEFYQNVLGFDFRGYWDPVHDDVVDVWQGEVQPEYAEVYVGENRVGLQPSSNGIQPGAAEFALRVDDVDRLYQSVLEAGVHATPPVNERWGSRHLTVQDPDGHIWHFLQPLT